jgi:hypothetical protein
MAPSLISISPVLSETPNSAEPQDGQKFRASSCPSTSRYRRESPRAQPPRRHSRYMALSLRQVVQWHRPILMGGPLASIRMAPQLQLAVRVSGMSLLVPLAGTWHQTVTVTRFQPTQICKNRTDRQTSVDGTPRGGLDGRRPIEPWRSGSRAREHQRRARGPLLTEKWGY